MSKEYKVKPGKSVAGARGIKKEGEIVGLKDVAGDEDRLEWMAYGPKPVLDEYDAEVEAKKAEKAAKAAAKRAAKANAIEEEEIEARKIVEKKNQSEVDKLAAKMYGKKGKKK